MDCKHVNEHLIDYLYQELDSEQLDQIEGHLNSCEGCAGELAAFESTRQVLRKLPELEPPPALGQALMQEAIKAVVPDQEAGFWERLRAGLRLMVLHPAMTAAVLAVVVVSVGYFIYRGGPPSMEPEADTLTPVSSPAIAPGTAEEAIARPPGTPTTTDRTAAKASEETEGRRAEDPREVQGKLATRQAGEVPAGEVPEGPVGGVEKAPAPAVRLARRARRARPRPRLVSTGTPRTRGLPAKAAPRPSGAKRDALDDLIDGAAKKSGSGGGEGEALAYKPKSTFAAKPRPKPPRRAKARPQPRSTPRPSDEPAGGGKLVYVWLAKANAASEAGRCEEALDYFDRALRVQPKLGGKVGGLIKRCVTSLAQRGEDYLYRALKRYPRLARWLNAELRKVRARSRKPKKAPAQRNAY